MKIGKLQEVEIRDLWHHEQYDFSAWLVKDDNIALLNEKLGLTLVDINTEAYVGAYRCDIVAVDKTTGIKVIIENQLENSNHDHLGKIIALHSYVAVNDGRSSMYPLFTINLGSNHTYTESYNRTSVNDIDKDEGGINAYYSSNSKYIQDTRSFDVG